MKPLELVKHAQSIKLTDEDGNEVAVRLYPGLSETEIHQFEDSLPCRIPQQIRELLSYTRGFEGLIENVDFTGRDMDFEHELFPHGLAIAHDGFGNFWVADLHAGSDDWAPIYFACHDAPVVLLQSYSLSSFLEELVKMFVPPFQSVIDDVHEDKIYRVWNTNPNVLTREACLASGDIILRTFAAGLEQGYEIIDLRSCKAGFGFSWGRYGPGTETRRFNEYPVFAYRKPRNKGLLARLFGI